MTDCEDGVLLGSPARAAIPPWDIDAYDAKVLALNPLCYLELTEKSGAVAADSTPNEYDNTISGANWLYQQGGIGDGKPSMSSQGLASHDIDAPAAMDAIINAVGVQLNEGSWAAWLYAEEADYLTGNNGFLFELDETGPEVIYLRLIAGGSNFGLLRRDGSATQNAFHDNGGALGWFHIGGTWSLSNDRVRLYYDGIQQGADVTGLSSSGSVHMSMFGRGALDSWPGRIAKIAYWGSEVVPSTMLSLATP